MKNLLLLIVLVFSTAAFGQKAETKVAKIKTSAECGQCKTRIEEKLNYTSGVRYAELNVLSKVVTVKYVTNKISLAEIRKIISELGYSADDVPAVKEAVEKLPLCCKPGGMKK